VRFDPFGDDRNCGDFTDWQTAQSFFVAAGGRTDDPHQLDRDNDGTACESLTGAP
jgi:micrococcal nuclease